MHQRAVQWRTYIKIAGKQQAPASKSKNDEIDSILENLQQCWKTRGKILVDLKFWGILVRWKTNTIRWKGRLAPKAKAERVYCKIKTKLFFRVASSPQGDPVMDHSREESEVRVIPHILTFSSCQAAFSQSSPTLDLKTAPPLSSLSLGVSPSLSWATLTNAISILLFLILLLPTPMHIFFYLGREAVLLKIPGIFIPGT